VVEECVENIPSQHFPPPEAGSAEVLFAQITLTNSTPYKSVTQKKDFMPTRNNQNTHLFNHKSKYKTELKLWWSLLKGLFPLKLMPTESIVYTNYK
jgi:hypothetical protein